MDIGFQEMLLSAPVVSANAGRIKSVVFISQLTSFPQLHMQLFLNNQPVENTRSLLLMKVPPIIQTGTRRAKPSLSRSVNFAALKNGDLVFLMYI